MTRRTSFLRAAALALAGVYSGGALATANLVDDFSGDALDNIRWWRPESTRRVDPITEKLVMTSRFAGRTDIFCESCTRLQFADPTLASIQADIAVSDIELGGGDTKWVFGRVGGYFYNTSTDAPGLAGSAGYEGDVFAATAIGDRGNGLEAWWEITEYRNEAGDDVVKNTGSLIAPGTLVAGQAYTVAIAYDGDATFVFTVDGATSGNVTGPARMGPPVLASKRLNAGVYTGMRAVDGTFDSDDFVHDDGTPGSVTATFDNVFVNGDVTVYDDFSGTRIDQGRWVDAEITRVLDNGKLRLEVDAAGASTESVNLPTSHGDARLVQAALTLLGTSDIPLGSRGRVRIDGTWYNRLYDSNYNGHEGDVYAHLVLEKIESGSIRAAVYAEAVNNAEWTDATELLFDTFTRPVAFDTEYVASIELTDDALVFTFDGEVIEYPIATDIHPPSPGLAVKQIRARLQPGPGIVHALIDNVHTDNEAPVINTGGDRTVAPGERVTLTAMASDEDDIIAWFWEQTEGPAVTISPQRVRPAEVAGAQSIVFDTLADEQTVRLRVTAIDRYGAESSADVSVTAEIEDEGSDGGDSSSTAAGPALLALFALGFAWRRYAHSDAPPADSTFLSDTCAGL